MHWNHLVPSWHWSKLTIPNYGSDEMNWYWNCQPNYSNYFWIQMINDLVHVWQFTSGNANSFQSIEILQHFSVFHTLDIIIFEIEVDKIFRVAQSTEVEFRQWNGHQYNSVQTGKLIKCVSFSLGLPVIINLTSEVPKHFDKSATFSIVLLKPMKVWMLAKLF